jgi:hypothetical protein
MKKALNIHCYLYLYLIRILGFIIKLLLFDYSATIEQIVLGDVAKEIAIIL